MESLNTELSNPEKLPPKGTVRKLVPVKTRVANSVSGYLDAPESTGIRDERTPSSAFAHLSFSDRAQSDGSQLPPSSSEADSIQPVSTSSYTAFKRGMDIIGSLTLLVALTPVIALAAIGIALASPGPILFRQNRVTIGGRIFSMWKLRTMHLNAEAESGPVFTQMNDNRIFSFGRLLRRTHIDELPQLVNVLRGEMSLIGPRPERPEFVARLREQFPEFDKRHKVRAGITGLAQISAGYADNVRRYRRKLLLDNMYINNCSLALDLLIALRTIGVFFSGAGSR